VFALPSDVARPSLTTFRAEKISVFHIFYKWINLAITSTLFCTNVYMSYKFSVGSHWLALYVHCPILALDNVHNVLAIARMIPFTGNVTRAVPQSNSGVEIEEFFDTKTGKNGDDKVLQSAPLPPRELPGSLDKVQYGDEREDFDAIYEDEGECDAGNAVEPEHGTVLMHLLSQVPH
jgi:hypothetical protein